MPFIEEDTGCEVEYMANEAGAYTVAVGQVASAFVARFSPWVKETGAAGSGRARLGRSVRSRLGQLTMVRTGNVSDPNTHAVGSSRGVMMQRSLADNRSSRSMMRREGLQQIGGSQSYWTLDSAWYMIHAQRNDQKKNPRHRQRGLGGVPASSGQAGQ